MSLITPETGLFKTVLLRLSEYFPILFFNSALSLLSPESSLFKFLLYSKLTFSNSFLLRYIIDFCSSIFASTSDNSLRSSRCLSLLVASALSSFSLISSCSLTIFNLLFKFFRFVSAFLIVDFFPFLSFVIDFILLVRTSFSNLIKF